MKPAHKAIQFLKYRGWLGDHTERRRGPMSYDWMGFADVLCFREDSLQILAVQATSPSNVAARLEKIRNNPLAYLFLRAGHAVWIMGFDKSDDPDREECSRIIKLQISQNGAISAGESYSSRSGPSSESA
jgi:hypothetical protein